MQAKSGLLLLVVVVFDGAGGGNLRPTCGARWRQQAQPLPAAQLGLPSARAFSWQEPSGPTAPAGSRAAGQRRSPTLAPSNPARCSTIGGTLGRESARSIFAVLLAEGAALAAPFLSPKAAGDGRTTRTANKASSGRRPCPRSTLVGHAELLLHLAKSSACASVTCRDVLASARLGRRRRSIGAEAGRDDEAGICWADKSVLVRGRGRPRGWAAERGRRPRLSRRYSHLGRACSRIAGGVTRRARHISGSSSVRCGSPIRADCGLISACRARAGRVCKTKAPHNYDRGQQRSAGHGPHLPKRIAMRKPVRNLLLPPHST